MSRNEKFLASNASTSSIWSENLQVILTPTKSVRILSGGSPLRIREQYGEFSSAHFLRILSIALARGLGRASTMSDEYPQRHSNRSKYPLRNSASPTEVGYSRPVERRYCQDSNFGGAHAIIVGHAHPQRHQRKSL